MRFSIITPSYLGEYRTAAKDRDKKILRAVNSVLNQSFTDFELIIIADGCEKTINIIIDNIIDPRVNLYSISRNKLWSGVPRNVGLEQAKGDYIVYLDIDDFFGKDHLKNLNAGLNGFDWIWFDDVRFFPKTKQWYENPCDIRQIGRFGTSNICHKRELPYKWEHEGYAHDYYFILKLKENPNFAKIEGGEYYVGHIPGRSGGYDI